MSDDTAQPPKQFLVEDTPTLRELEQRYISFVLVERGGNKAGTARQLGIGRKTLYRKLKRLLADGERQ